MKTFLAAFLVFVAGATTVYGNFTVHEWGTFTSVSGSDGRQLSGLEAEEANLPAFVHSFAGFSPANRANKGWNRPVSGVTIKMETPVLYFYSDSPRAVQVKVAFHGGSISQWYPDREDGEQMRDPSPAELPNLAPVDFSRGYEGSAVWRIDILPRDTPLGFTATRDLETPQWPRARVATANRVRGSKGEIEYFIFYRGIGNFSLPLKVASATDGTLTLSNASVERIPFVWVYQKRDGNLPAESWTGALAAGETLTAGGLRQEDVPFGSSLVAAGLTEEEAKALMATWRESYFERPGLRVFWIVPLQFTDAILPITINPAPEKLARVLVGRSEVLTPQFEAELVREFAANGGKRWENDRYFHAYRERVQQLGGTVLGAAPAGTP